MLEHSDFEQNCWSRTATDFYKFGHDSIRLMKLICFYDRYYYENLNYYDLMASLVEAVKYYYNCKFFYL